MSRLQSAVLVVSPASRVRSGSGWESRARAKRGEQAVRLGRAARIGTPVTAVIVIVVVLAVLLVLFLVSAIRVMREYERAVVFRLGRLIDPPKGPGLFLLI